MYNQQIDFIKKSLYNRQFTKGFYNSLLSVLKRLVGSRETSALWHPLGFVILTLQDWNLKDRLRIHIWTDTIRKYNQDRNWIHNHEYDIISLVLMGNIINERYQQVIKTDKESLPIYNVFHYENNSDLKITGNYCGLEFLSRDEVKKGEVYSISKGEFHLSETLPTEITSTIVLNTDKQLESPSIIGLRSKEDKVFAFKREACDRALLDRLIIRLVDQLEKQ